MKMTLDKTLKLILMVTVIFIVLTLLIFASSPAASSQRPDLSPKNKNAILLKNAQFDTTILPPSKGPLPGTNVSNDTSNDYYIVQFRGYIKDEMKQAIINTGAELFDYVPNNAFIVHMDATTKMQVESLDVVQWVGSYQPEYRISPALSVSAAKKNETGSDEIIYENVTVLLFDTEDNKQVSGKIKKLGGKIVERSGGKLLVIIEPSKIPELSLINGVNWIEKYVQPEISNDIAATIIHASEMQNTHGLTGSGQIVAVADSGLDTGIDDHGVIGDIHLDFDGRVAFINYIGSSPDDNNGHGTHTTGSVAGNGSRSGGTYRGMAPGANIVFQGLGDDSGSTYIYFPFPGGFSEVLQDAYDSGARIHSDSWGSADGGEYTSLSQETDQFVWNNKESALFTAAGNNGPGANTINSPGSAKNVITVGASENYRPSKGSLSDNIDQVASFSSRGPTDDGRIKPDVVAPGTYIISTRSSMPGASYSWGIVDSYYAYNTGTSMATPTAAGAGALVRQYYVDNESIVPSAALIKATLINGAIDLGLSSDLQGWGRIDITNSLFPEYPGSIRYHDEQSGGGLSTSGSWNISYYMANSSIPLRTTLVWTDHEANPGAGIKLVNDLDLMVTGPSGSYPGNGGDNINNVEQVELPEPSIGMYTFYVNGMNVPQGPQPFALVISGGVSDVIGLVNGHVKDAVSRVGIGGAMITPGSRITNITDGSGFYSFFLEEGLYQLNVTGDFWYYSNNSVTVEVLADLSVVQDILLERKPTGNISGFVSSF
ncbi:MAG: S8 family serine peptidase [Methanosarcinales archaeon]|nr:S8 family serine peptidase [Methanosarcinales archaeon]